MKRSGSKNRPPRANARPPVARLRRGGAGNPKLGAQTRKRLGKHYASKYRTGRRG
jgi:hypothetical protein